MDRSVTLKKTQVDSVRCFDNNFLSDQHQLPLYAFDRQRKRTPLYLFHSTVVAKSKPTALCSHRLPGDNHNIDNLTGSLYLSYYIFTWRWNCNMPHLSFKMTICLILHIQVLWRIAAYNFVFCSQTRYHDE